MKETDIKQICIERITRLPAVKTVKEKQGGIRKDAVAHDAILEIGTEWGKVEVIAEIKTRLTRPAIQHLLLIRRNDTIPFVLFTEYVNAAVADELKKNQMNFVDCQGNVFLYIPDKIYVDVQGKKPDKTPEKTQTALFQPKGMQLIFVLLTQENAINEPIRVLKQKAGIAFERVATAMNELLERGYVFETKNNTVQWLKKKELLEKWLVNYGDRLRPKLVLGKYKIAPHAAAHAPELLHEAFPDDEENYALGGSLAGDCLIHYYRGQTTEIFVRPEQAERVRLALRLMPAGETDATLLNLFTREVLYRDQKIRHPVVHPLLIYAELLYQGGDRAADAAGRIYDAYLKAGFNET